MSKVRTITAAALLGLSATWVLQGAGQKIDTNRLLVGQAAFADYPSVKPGVFRKITVADLPAPLATPSSTNRAQVIERPADAWPQALYRGCVATSTSAGSPRLTTSTARRIAGPRSLGSAIGPSA